ncbi:MAG: UbiA family prenyltransferase [Flavitalea sp.]
MAAGESEERADAAFSRPVRTMIHFIVFSSVYIAVCALVMIAQTNKLLLLEYNTGNYFLFVFFSTLCSYNFHWGMTPFSETDLIRLSWTNRHKTLHLIFFLVGLVGAAWFFIPFMGDWLWLSIGAVLTFLYSAPKVPFLRPLKNIAIGKTLFLALVWMYVTSALPILLSHRNWLPADYLFCTSRFLLIYAICILFDYRDRDYDRKEGIKSMVTLLSEKGVTRLYVITLILFAVSTTALALNGLNIFTVILLVIPGVIMVPMYNIARKNFSDYLYYILLDGMMMFSSLLTLFI